MWTTDRVRICVKELCRIRCEVYLPIGKEEGLTLLAQKACCTVAELERMNPILYVRMHLNDSADDPVELLIKLCAMFGPWSYKAMAVALLLPAIPEVESPTPTECSVDVSEAIVHMSEASVNVSECSVDVSECSVDVSDASVNVSECSVDESIDSFDTSANDSAIQDQIQEEVRVIQDQIPQKVTKTARCGCFPWFTM